MAAPDTAQLESLFSRGLVRARERARGREAAVESGGEAAEQGA